MNGINNLKTGVKIIGGFILVALIIVVVAVIGFVNMQKMDTLQTGMYNENLKPISELGIVRADVQNLRGNAYKFILIKELRDATEKDIATASADADKQIELYSATGNFSEEDKANLDRLKTAWSAYKIGVTGILDDVKQDKVDEALANIQNGPIVKSRADLDAALTDINNASFKNADNANSSAKAAFSSATMMSIIAALAGIILAIVLGLFISNAITKPLAVLEQAAKMLSVGELLRDMDDKQRAAMRARKDEIGDIAHAFTAMIAYMQSMGAAATEVANGNLTVAVTPASAKDELGNAFAHMLTNLKDAFARIQQGANNVAAASAQLSSASEQAGAATGQVATTIQQVARGTTEQTASITAATSQVEQMARASEGIARGAQEQAESVQRTSGLITEMASLVEEVESSSESIVSAVEEVLGAAKEGAQASEQTKQGMDSIQNRTTGAAEKVKEMGERAQEVGRIVETIDDIADKTDMLALNAAVEAARAGEHGRGFAVVADQVRKLSEDSKLATREITELVNRVQAAVREAMAAMEASTNEVVNGSQLATHAAELLEQIQSQAKVAAEVVEKIGTLTGQVKQKTDDVVSAIESVSAVVEENTASAEELAAGGASVTEAIEGVASVSEENSAAAQEVSAATEEMSAQVEEVSASAEELTALAEELRAVVAQFKLDDNVEVEKPALAKASPARAAEKPAAERKTAQPEMAVAYNNNGQNHHK